MAWGAAVVDRNIAAISLLVVMEDIGYSLIK